MPKRLFIQALLITALLLAQLFAIPGAVFANFIPSDGQAATLVLGQADFTHSDPATTQTGMSYAAGVAVDPITGKVFVAERDNSRVLRFASAASLSNGAAAEAVLGQADFTGGSPNRGDLPAANTLYHTNAVFVDAAGSLWVADAGNNRVLRFDNASFKLNGVDADGVLGQPNFTSYTAHVTSNGMWTPTGVFVDSGGRLWVADLNNSRVLRFDNASSKANGANADGVLGQPDFTSSGRATTQSGVYYPHSVYVDAGGRLWVADTHNNRVLRFDNAAAKANGANADGVLGQADFTHDTAACTRSGMDYPFAVSGDLAGRLYVASTSQNRVLIFTAAAARPNGDDASYVLGQSNFTTCTPDTGGISASSLDRPDGIFYDPAARVLWVAEWENNRVLRYGEPDVLATQVLGQANFTSNTAATTQIRMDNPYGVAVDPATYKVFVAELNNHRVLRFASLFALSNGAAAEAVLGQANFTSGSPNRGGAAAANTLNGPTGVFVDTGGRLWVADYNNHRVLRFNNASTKSNGANADGVLGQANFTSSAPATSQSRMNYPVGVFVDSGGRLWVADSDNHRVLRFDNAASKANGANADGVLGQANFTSNTPATSQNRMDKPVGVYLDPGGRLWVTEFNNNRLMRFNNAAAKANGANADGVLGQANFTSSGSACASMAMDTPRGVAGDSAGRIYVADGNNHRVLVFEDAATSPNGNAADDVIGQPNFTNCSLYSAWPTAGSLNTPALIFYDIPMGVLWVADWNNNRVLRYDPYQLKLFLPIVEK